MPDDEFSQFGGSAVADAPDEFAEFGGHSASSAPVDPVTQGQQKSQSYLDALNAGQAPLADSPEAHYAAAKDYFDGDALTQNLKGAGSGIGNFFAHPTVALGNIGTAIGNWDRNASTQFDQEAKNHPLSGIPRLIGSGAAGLASGVVGLADKGVNFLDDIGNYGNQLISKATGDTDPGKERAYADFYQRQNAAKLAGATAAVRNAVPSSAAFDTGENIAPFLAPVPSLGLAGPIAKISKGIGGLAEDGTILAAKAAPIITPIAGVATDLMHGNPFGVAGNLVEATTGVGAGQIAKKGLLNIAPKVGDAATQLTGAGLNTAAAGASNLAFSLAGAPAGTAEQNAEGAMANTAFFSPIPIIHGATARQDLNEATLAKQAALRGMQEYGSNPELDAATARGIASLDPDQQKAVFEQRGLFRDIQNPEGKQIQIHVPDNYAEGAQAANGGSVDDAANSRGYYLDGQGKVFINPDGPDVPGALQQALGHEVGHSVYQDALPAVNARASERLTNAVTGQALDANLQPTPGFQSFINQYAEAAGSGPVDWNKLPVSGPGLTRNYLLNELGAETVRAATPEVGKQLAGRELSDKVGDFASDLATRLGLKSAPDATAILGPDGQPVPLSVSALQAARKGTYAIGAKAQQGFDSPVRIAEPDKPATPPKQTSPSQTNTPQESNVAQSPSTDPDTSFRQTQAYQDALKTLTSGAVGKKMDPVTATAMLDRAAQRPDVPDTLEDYLRFAQTGQAPRQAPNIAPVQPATPAENAPSLAPVASAQPTSPILAPTSQANAFGPPTPIGTSEGKRINLLYGAKRLEVPTATQPVLTLPKVTPKTELPPVEPVNRFAGNEEPPVTGPTDNEAASSSAGESKNPNPNQEPSEVSGEHPSAPSTAQSSSADSSASSPLSASDIARIESEAEKSFTPAPYKPQGTPEERTAKIAAKNAADLAKAKADAVAKAHSDSLPPEDDRVRAAVDPDTGAVKLSGKRFVEGDAFHDQLLRNATDDEKANLSTVQDAIGQGKALNFDYDSALPLRGEDTNAQRQESQALSTATDREQGVGLAQEANHTFVPLSASPTASGHAQVYGYAPDKVLGNAETAIQLMRDSGLSDRLPYTSINDPSLTSDIRAYTENHVNGYKGDGSAKLQATEGVNVPQGDPSYQPQPLPPAKAHFINLIMGQDDTLSQKQAVKTGPNAGKPTNSATLRNFAAANDNVPSASGEVNPLRDELNRKGVLKVGNDKGSGEVLHSAFENIKPGLITRFHDQPGTSEVPPLRASSFEGDRGSIAPGGKVPSRTASAAGFLPAREAGAATPEQVADAAKAWKEQGTDSPYFQKWFGDSQIKDAAGNPTIVYHGTHRDFDTFDRLAGRTNNANKPTNGIDELGTWFTDKPENGRLYGAKNVAAYLQIKKPFVIYEQGTKGSAFQKLRTLFDKSGGANELRDKLTKAGFDGIQLRDAILDREAQDVTIAFHPEQIKNAEHNQGTFNPQDSRINF